MLRSEDVTDSKNSVTIAQRMQLKDPANRSIIMLKNRYLYIINISYKVGI